MGDNTGRKDVLSRVNYRVGEGLPASGRVVHINNLKVYKERKIFRAVVAIEEESEVGNIRKVSNSLGEESCMGYNEGQLQEVLSEFSDTFKDTPGCCLTTDCNIELEWDAVPVNLPVRRVPFNIRGGVKDALTRMVDDGVIEPVRDSRWCSPIVPVRKPDGSIRVCVDYRAVNEVTPLVRHYMPTLDELLERAGGCGVLLTLDLTTGFHQVRIGENSKDITTFGSPWGKFRFRRMPFGLKNAPAVFQAMVDGVLSSVKDTSGCYIDDVLIYTRT